MNPKLVIPVIGAAAVLLAAAIIVPILAISGMLATSSTNCSSQQSGSAAVQPAASAQAKAIPANYLYWYQAVGQQYGVPWTILAGIGTVESDNGQTTLAGVHSGQNGFGAAGPMQIGIGGAATNVWGGAPVHPASEVVNGVATDEDGGPNADVYDPADAIAGAAKYLLSAGVRTNPSGAVFAYNHLQSYVQSVLSFANAYGAGNFSVTSAQTAAGTSADACTLTESLSSAPNQVVAAAIAYAEQQIGKPYLWGGTGPDAFDCSGLVMMAYRAAGVGIARTSEAQWVTEPHVPASQVEPGDLVFFAGADGTPASPGHVGLVIGGGEMIEAYATGFPIRIATYTDRNPGGLHQPLGQLQHHQHHSCRVINGIFSATWHLSGV